MIRSAVQNAIAAAFAAAILSSVAACDGGPAAPQGSDELAEVGKISLPLVTTTNDHVYRLRDVYIIISGPQFGQLFSSNDPAETTLSTTLQTGGYIAYLIQWTLERDDGTGNFGPVPATLISASAVNFTIFNGATSTVEYQFRTDGVIVRVGAGELRVKASVDEIQPVCTPFGNDCPEGTWCPPTGLTGRPLACIPAGTTPVGGPCTGPEECAAGSTCLDLGAGPLCTDLCPMNAAGDACASGGTCQTTSAADYAVCASAAEGTP